MTLDPNKKITRRPLAKFKSLIEPIEIYSKNNFSEIKRRLDRAKKEKAKGEEKKLTQLLRVLKRASRLGSKIRAGQDIFVKDLLNLIILIKPFAEEISDEEIQRMNLGTKLHLDRIITALKVLNSQLARLVLMLKD